MLKKKHNSISYHKVRECIASGTLRVGKEPTETNLYVLMGDTGDAAVAADVTLMQEVYGVYWHSQLKCAKRIAAEFPENRYVWTFLQIYSNVSIADSDVADIYSGGVDIYTVVAVADMTGLQIYKNVFIGDSNVAEF